MTELVDDHNYVLDSIPKVIASAHNSLGDGTYSDPNTSGAEVTTLPVAMATPSYSSLSESSVTITWTALSGDANIGGTAITTYNLYWDNGTGTTSISVENSLVTSKTVPGLVGGTIYKFKVRA